MACVELATSCCKRSKHKEIQGRKLQHIKNSNKIMYMIFIDNMHKQKIIGNIKNTFQTKILLSKKNTNKQAN